MIKMRAPEGLTGFTHQGFPVEIIDGVAHVDPRFRADFEAHGFLADGDAPPPAAPVPVSAVQQVPAPAPAPIMDLRRQALLEAYARHLDTLSDDEISGTLALLRENGQPVPPPRSEREAAERDAREADDADSAEGEFDPLTVTAADLPGLKRPQLFAVLKARNVPAVPPISNDVLRAKALAAIGA
jgi:hypothetical protein